MVFLAGWEALIPGLFLDRAPSLNTALIGDALVSEASERGGQRLKESWLAPQSDDPEEGLARGLADFRDRLHVMRSKSIREEAARDLVEVQGLFKS